MSALLEGVNTTSEIIMESSSDEEFKFIWTVSNYSKIIKDISANFRTACGLEWKIQLEIADGPGYTLKLRRCSEDRLVPVFIEYVIAVGELIYPSLDVQGRELSAQESVCTLFEYPASASTSDTETMSFSGDVLEIYFVMALKNVGITNTAKSLAFDLRKFLEKGEHCDMTISVGEVSIPVHKSVICSRSPVLDKMFQHGLLESKCTVIEIDDIDVAIVKHFVKFLYSGELKNISTGVALKLYYAAEKYDVHDLRNACSKILQFNLDRDKACDVLKLAYRFKDDKLKEAAKAYVRIHASYLKLTDSWEDLVKCNPKLAVEVFKY